MFTTTLPTKPGKYWVRNAPVMQGLGLKKTDIMDVFWDYGYYDDNRDGKVLCVGVHGWHEELSSFITREKSSQPEWSGPLTPPE